MCEFSFSTSAKCPWKPFVLHQRHRCSISGDRDFLPIERQWLSLFHPLPSRLQFANLVIRSGEPASVKVRIFMNERNVKAPTCVRHAWMDCSYPPPPLPPPLSFSLCVLRACVSQERRIPRRDWIIGSVRVVFRESDRDSFLAKCAVVGEESRVPSARLDAARGEVPPGSQGLLPGGCRSSIGRRRRRWLIASNRRRVDEIRT